MKLIQLLAAGAAVAVVPAVAGLVGNPSFSQSVPVPAAQHSAATPATPTAKPSAARTHDANDDHGGRRARGTDDGPNHDANDDHGGRHGGDDHGSGGHGSDD